MKTKLSKPKNQTDAVYDFFLENKVAQHFELSDAALKERFTAWVKTKEQAWIEYYDCESAIRFFITDKEGLNSTHEEFQFKAMYNALKPIYLNAHK